MFVRPTQSLLLPRFIWDSDFVEKLGSRFGCRNQGEGLERITFYNPQGEPLGKLLTRNEIIHLQDVANLIDKTNLISLGLFVICLVLLALIYIYRIRMPALRTITMGTVLFVILCVLAVISFGAKKFFYWLHTVIFPDNHQWFFYYEESLMSTLMKAPALFAPISIQIVILGLSLWAIQLGLLYWLNNHKDHDSN